MDMVVNKDNKNIKLRSAPTQAWELMVVSTLCGSVLNTTRMLFRSEHLMANIGE